MHVLRLVSHKNDVCHLLFLLDSCEPDDSITAEVNCKPMQLGL